MFGATAFSIESDFAKISPADRSREQNDICVEKVSYSQVACMRLETMRTFVLCIM